MSKTLNVKIISLKTPKTAIVQINTNKIHPLYKKIIKGVRKFSAHYEIPDLKIGDQVEVKEVKPISKTKHFIITKIINPKIQATKSK